MQTSQYLATCSHIGREIERRPQFSVTTKLSDTIIFKWLLRTLLLFAILETWRKLGRVNFRKDFWDRHLCLLFGSFVCFLDSLFNNSFWQLYVLPWSCLSEYLMTDVMSFTNYYLVLNTTCQWSKSHRKRFHLYFQTFIFLFMYYFWMVLRRLDMLWFEFIVIYFFGFKVIFIHCHT